MGILTDGYVTDINYTNSFYRDLTPNFLRPTLLMNGTDFPKRNGEPFRYLELGFGAGTSLNIHAATMEGEFWGNDFNPNHVMEAEIIAQNAHLDTRILDDTFKQLEEKSRQGLLPKFDMIALHGIWSWVSQENRQYILNIIDNNLKAGGIVYLSYNALPGWANFMPIRNLFTSHAQILGNESQSSLEKFQESLEFVQHILDENFKFISDDPSIKERIQEFDMNNLPYLVHEYMNESWNAFYFKEVAETLASVRCSFLSSSRLLNHLSVSLPKETEARIKDTKDVILRETLRDYAQNQQFRCDIFVKGKSVSSVSELNSTLSELHFTLSAPLSSLSLEFKTVIGTVDMDESIYMPILQGFTSDNYIPKSFRQIQEHPFCKNIPPQKLVDALEILLGTGYIHAAQIPSKKIQEQTIKLNRVLCKTAISNDYSKVLASSVLGSAIAVSHLDLLILLARSEGKTQYNELIPYIIPIIKKLGGIQAPDGSTPSDDDLVKDLRNELENFIDNRLPYYQAMGLESL